MPSRLSPFVVLVGALAFAPLWIDGANAQDYPSRLIKIIVPFPPGGNPDLAARLVAERMSAAFRQPVIIENRPGANGALGASAVAKAARDGYTLLVTSLGVLAINPAIYDQLPYNPKTDFAQVSRLAISPLLLMSKSRKHFLTIGYEDESGGQQAMVFRVDKKDVRAVLASLEARTGLRVTFQDEEARKAGKG